jgi:cell division protein FtsL
MSPQAFEYPIKKDIRNNPIVREVDAARQRELWRSMAIGTFLVAVLLFSAWQHFGLLQHGYEVELLQQERARELEINRHLRLEIESLRSPSRIERIATEQLNLVAPTGNEAVVIERVRPAPVPDGSIVATNQRGPGDDAEARR